MAILALSPFPIASLLYCFGPAELKAPSLTSLLAWAAVVLSFLGGVRWGLESGEPRPRAYRLAFSALSAVAAWVVLLARGNMPDSWILMGFIAAFMVQWLFDHRAPDTPARYPSLSTVLTAGACISLALALETTLNS
jgi:hypothetical protein